MKNIVFKIIIMFVQFFRDLGDYANNNQQSLWIEKDRELGKGGFGVVLKGELGNQVNHQTQFKPHPMQCVSTTGE